jgi:hypothetical protein
VQVRTHLASNGLGLTKTRSLGARDVERLQRLAVLASRQVEQALVVRGSSQSVDSASVASAEGRSPAAS